MLACACKHIVASETAKIGSIGVISQNYNFAGITKKAGFESKTFSTGEYKEGK
jgi:ClpP class serine protease